MDRYLTALVARESFSMEYRLRRRDGIYRWIYDQGVPRFDTKGNFVGYIGSCVDITDARGAHDSLRRPNHARAPPSLELAAAPSDREVLLREVHHRVKNTLQLISSMMSMQARQRASDAAADALIECQDRIQAIALVHERLYESPDLSRVSFREYTESLVAHV